MGISFNPNLLSIGSIQQTKFNTPRITFGNNPYGDSFQNNSVEKLFDETKIKTMIFHNKELRQILKENNIPIRLNMTELQELREKHCKETQNICIDIAKNLPQALKEKVNIKDLKDGAILHDFGKVLIPQNVLNKKGSLTPDEHKIMDLHTQIGYLLLKNNGINNNVLELVKNHHNPKFDINQQILNLADKYSALTEERVYKSAMSPQKALTVLSTEVQKGEINPIIFNALVQSVHNSIDKQNIKIS